MPRPYQGIIHPLICGSTPGSPFWLNLLGKLSRRMHPIGSLFRCLNLLIWLIRRSADTNLKSLCEGESVEQLANGGICLLARLPLQKQMPVLPPMPHQTPSPSNASFFHHLYIKDLEKMCAPMLGIAINHFSYLYLNLNVSLKKKKNGIPAITV